MMRTEEEIRRASPQFKLAARYVKELAGEDWRYAQAFLIAWQFCDIAGFVAPYVPKGGRVLSDDRKCALRGHVAGRIGGR